MRCGRIFSASGDGQFRRGCGAYSTGALGGDRAEAANIAIELSLDRHADARHFNRSCASTRGAAINDACAPQPHSQSVLASSGLMHEDAGRRSEWSWRHALQFRVHLRKRERGPAFDGRSTSDAEPSLQLNNRPPSLGGFPKHQHLPCPRAPVARQLFSDAPSDFCKQSSVVSRVEAGKATRYSPRTSLPSQRLPPFLAELCHRKHGQLVLAVSFNLCILNDHGLQTPPPTMPYAVGMDAVFKSRALNHLKKLKLRRSPMSPAFMGLVSSWDYKDCPISDGE